jgi:hypothetical protein
MSLNDIMNEENTIVSNNSSKIMVDSKICVQDKKVDCLSTLLMDNEQSTIINKPIDIGDPSKVNITIKSCKNITSKQALLIIPITKFFSDKKVLNRLITILKGEGLSLRLIDWFVTNYCKKFNVMYNVMDFRDPIPGQSEAQRKSFDNFIIVHTNYKGQLKAYSKKNFDPFCRRNRIRFYYEDNKYFITTVGQLNFFKWALEMNIVDYVEKYIKEIEDDMNLRCENIKKPGTKIAYGAANGINATGDEETGTKKNKPQDGSIPVIIEKNNKTKKAIGTRKKRKEISQSASKSLSIHNVPTTLIFD